ncbi:hypothetical protein I3843_08G139200 [Carya illinoinensis]|uniref:ABC transporter G family member STR2 n=1 Tax=Carya illinoinensis TaxID=32201 RepID=A0A922EDK2_CARIL|nr:hypothetical protein I3842_08G144800 [Carya illinoinensis]KAG7968165.1 hypothetical protein I3843_08G139200 [Carya illinoinensis]
MASAGDDHRRETVIDIGKLVSFTGKSTRRAEVDFLNRIIGYAPKGCITAVMSPSGAGKSTLLDGLAGRIASGSLKGRVSLDGMETSPRLIKRTSAYIMHDDKLFPMLTVYETLMFVADFWLGPISTADKQQCVEKLIEQLGFSSCRNTYIGDEGTRGVSGGEHRRVSIGVDIIHGPSLLFLDEPTSGLDSTSAHSVIEKVHHIAHSGSTVILTIHQPSSRIQLLLDHLIILACGQLMYQGSPKDVAHHLARIGRKVPKGENSVEYLIDVIQQYDKSELGVEVLAKFALTDLKPLPLADKEISVSSAGKRQTNNADQADYSYDYSLRSPYNNNSKSWSASDLGVLQALRLTSSRTNEKVSISMSLSPRNYYQSSSEIIARTPQSSNYIVNESDYLTPEDHAPNSMANKHPGPKFAKSFFSETMILMCPNFKTCIYRTPELFLSRLMVLIIMGIMMATMFKNPKPALQGITNRISFFIFTICLFFFSSNDVVPAFIQECLITYLPFLALHAAVYAGIVWFALELQGPFIYFLIVLYVTLLSTNSFVVFVSSVVPNYILGYAAIITFTALFFLFCGYLLNSHDIPIYWKWMNKISLLMNQYQTDDSFGAKPNGEIVSGHKSLDNLNILRSEQVKWEKVLIMLGWAILYRVLFYLVLRFGSKSQRT